MSYLKSIPVRTFDTADDVESVVLLSAHVECYEGHEAGDLHEEVHQQRHPSVQRERSAHDNSQ